MQNLNGYGLAFFHCIPFIFREPTDRGALSQKNLPPEWVKPQIRKGNT
jgi:hypothetical protein